MSDEHQQTPSPEDPHRSLEKRLEDRRRQIEDKLEEKREQVEEKLREVKRSIAARITRGTLWTLGGVIAFLLAVFGIFAWYTTTADFEHRVNAKLVSVLEDATGGRVELKSFHFHLWKLAVEANGLVIHGLEPAGEAPYLSADRLELRVRILNFFSHIAGHGPASYISLNYLRVDRPQFHLIVDKDGKTNQPTPKHPSTSTKPITDTLLDLRAREVEVANGVALINNLSVPFDLAARDLDAEVHYIYHTDRYGATIDLRDLRTRIASEPEAQSSLHLDGELGRDVAVLHHFELHTGNASELKANASLTHFARPEWSGSLSGTVEVRQVAVMTGLDALRTGTVDLDLKARNCLANTPPDQKRPPFWKRIHPRLGNGKPAAQEVPAPEPGCPANFLVVGTAKVHGAGYRDEYVDVRNINATTQINLSPSEFALNEMRAVFPDGGTVTGSMRIEHWLGEVAADSSDASPMVKAAATTTNTAAKSVGAKPPVATVPKVTPSHAFIDAKLNGVPLRTILDITAEHFGDLGFDTAISGPVKVEWGGSQRDVADSVEVDGDLSLAPTGVRRKGAASNIPLSGHVLAHYTGSNETVRIQQLTAQLPQSNLTASGILGVNVGDPLTALQVDLTVHDLSEYNQLLMSLGLEAGGKKGSAAIPVNLHGALHFVGEARGAARNLDVKGHVEAHEVEIAMGSTDALIDSLVADAEYSPSTGVAVANSTIHRDTATLRVSGTVQPRRVVSKRGAVSYEWDQNMALDTTVELDDAQVSDVLEIVGQQEKIPVSGTATANAHVTGTIDDLNGTGHIVLSNGVAYGESFESVTADLAVHGKALDASRVVLKAHGLQVAGNGGYDLASKHLHGHIEGQNLELAKFDTVKKSASSVNGKVSLVADANGTVTEPQIKANVTLRELSYQGEVLGDAIVDAHSQGSTLSMTASSTIVGAKLNLSSQTQLTGDFQSQAKLTIADFDINRPLTMFGPGTLKAQSSISGVATISGPLKLPKQLGGTAELNNVDVKLQGIELKAAEPLRVSLRDGQATLDQVHIVGQDTDMRFSGNAQVFGSDDPKGGKLDMKGSGDVSMSLLHTFDPDVISSGKVTFTVAAGGRVMNPSLSGKVLFENVNLALDGVPNGLSNMKGKLVFTDDSLQVETLTAKSGGGNLNIKGAIRFRHGIFVDMSATGEAVRVRLYGLSATATANLKLQGTMTGALLSGNILITRFGVGQDVDFAAFAGAGGTISAPPDPDAAANKVRLDVHVTSSPQLDFQNSYAKLAGSVDLNIRGTVASPAILGKIQITDGSATFASTKYQLQRGDIFFTNPVRIDPAIDIDAVAQVENYSITVGLHGTASNLKPTYRSEPPLSEADVFALLALGRTQEEAQISQTQQLRAGQDPTTSALLGGALNATVSQRVEKLFGGGSVKIDPAFVGTLGNSSARITIQEQIGKQITATFATNVNSSAQQLLQVQYDLNPTSSIVIGRDESGVFSIVYKWRRRYR
ncbi:MAG: translocation/assembly module TamB domain-containing protein [Edaphobacter sp.]|uniref:translocation/assembly module TamB domain-containing protein n=1 Tax=Edaphobacter sp. TaxID=1934404 RepID=UPI0023A180AC|nr:translocation/assembly module TamB domain-containing protein [Edaphobacter sp.]MDE1177619.1 translocation/assembly module TamB domain-containing protein [Edaphobacter sp.]